MENIAMTNSETNARISKKTASFPYTIESWKPNDAHALYLLEKRCWAPWLRKSERDFLNIATNYPELQRLIKNKRGVIVASMSVNRIDWDGKAETFPTWDQIAGGAIQTSNFSTYNLTGNTLCLMSMNVSPTVQGIGLAQKLIEDLKQTARELNAQHIISSLRPTNYGRYKLEQIEKHSTLLTFEEYCSLTTKENKPYDNWLRSAFRQGIKQIGISKDSIVVTVEKKIFEYYVKRYKPQKWKRVSNNNWECGETGSWYIEGNNAIYKEDNLAVELPII